jgi:hypothetical protein
MTRMTLLSLGIGLSLVACSSDTLTEADYEDAAQTISASMVTGRSKGGGGGGGGGGGDLGVRGADRIVFREAVSLARGRLPLGWLRQDDHNCRGNMQGVDHAVTIVCKDAAGTKLAKCNDMTDSATITIQQTGELQTSHVTAMIDREGSFTITGLQSATATFNGDSSFSLDTQVTSLFHEGVTSTLELDATSSYQAITVSTADREVTGGSASFEVKAHRTVTGTPMGSHDVDKSFDVDADITFNADRTATLVLDGTQTFKIDLATGKITRVP